MKHMKIKEVRISSEGYEVTLAWTAEEIKSRQGIPLECQFKPNVDLLKLIEAELKEA